MWPKATLWGDTNHGCTCRSAMLVVDSFSTASIRARLRQTQLDINLSYLNCSTHDSNSRQVLHWQFFPSLDEPFLLWQFHRGECWQYFSSTKLWKGGTLLLPALSSWADVTAPKLRCCRQHSVRLELLSTPCPRNATRFEPLATGSNRFKLHTNLIERFLTSHQYLISKALAN